MKLHNDVQILKEDYLKGSLTDKSVKDFGKDIRQIIDNSIKEEKSKMTIEVSSRELENIIRALNVADEYYPWLASDMKILMDKLMSLYKQGQ